MIRVCPHSDGPCKNGLGCPYSCATGAYDGTKRMTNPIDREELAGRLEAIQYGERIMTASLKDIRQAATLLRQEPGGVSGPMVEAALATWRRAVEENKGPVMSVAVRFGTEVVTAPMPGFRHHHILQIAHSFGKRCEDPKDQGFADADGNFLTREEAGQIALAAGQIKKLLAPPRAFSEDFW